MFKSIGAMRAVTSDDTCNLRLQLAVRHHHYHYHLSHHLINIISTHATCADGIEWCMGRLSFVWSCYWLWVDTRACNAS